MDLREVEGDKGFIFWQEDHCFGRMDFLHNAFDHLAFIKLNDLLFISICFQSPQSCAILAFVPNSDLAHPGVFLSFLVVIKVLTGRLLAPQPGESFLQESNGGILTVDQYVADLNFVNFLLDNELKLIA